eukprot:3934469-Rhodomonas_salina.1
MFYSEHTHTHSPQAQHEAQAPDERATHPVERLKLLPVVYYVVPHALHVPAIRRGRIALRHSSIALRRGRIAL